MLYHGGMNVLMYGRNATVVLYGWALRRARHSVEFLPLVDDEVTTTRVSLDVLDARQDARGQWVSQDFVLTPRSGQVPELIVVAVRHDRLPKALAEAATLIPSAALLVLGNLWAQPEAVLGALSSERVFWAYPSAGGSWDDEGSSLRAALLAPLHVGTFGTVTTPRRQSVLDLFSDAGFRLEEHRDFRGWLWLQFAVGAGLAAHALEAGSVEALIDSPVRLRKAIATIRQLFPLVAARGVDLSLFAAEIGPFRFPRWLAGLVLQNTLRGNVPVRLVWLSGEEEERVLLVHDVLAEAKRLGVTVPELIVLEAAQER